MLNDIAPADADLKVVRGRMPADIGGAYFICSPDPRDDGPHGFYGSGVLYRLSLSPGQYGAGPDEYAWRHAMVATAGYRFRKRLPSEVLASAVGNASTIGPINSPNTGQVPWYDRLLVTWDGGRPVEMCPDTMQVLAEHGHRSQWDDGHGHLSVFPSIVAPAHPVIDPELGCLWTVCYRMFQDCTHVVMSDADSARVKRWRVRGALTEQVVHTIACTRHWIILCCNGMRIDPRELYGLERRDVSVKKAPVYLIRKEDLLNTPEGGEVDCKTVWLEPECMHFYAQYDDADGVRLLVEHSTDSDIAMAIRKGDRDVYGDPIDPRVKGMYGLALSPPDVSMVEIQPEAQQLRVTARYRDPSRMWNVQTSARDWSRAGQLSPTLHHTLYNGWRTEGVSERQFDLYAHRVDTAQLPTEDQPACLMSFDWQHDLKPASSYRWPDDAWATSPAFAPRRAAVAGGEDDGGYAGGEPGGHDGYVIVTVLRDHGAEFDIFDAADVGKGPVCTLGRQGHVVPFVIHANWMPHSDRAPELERVRFRTEIHEHMLAKLPRAYRAAVEDISDELDEEEARRGRASDAAAPPAPRAAE